MLSAQSIIPASYTESATLVNNYEGSLVLSACKLVTAKDICEGF